MKLYNVQSGQYEDVAESQVDQAIANGSYVPQQGTMKLLAPSGDEVDLDAFSVRDAITSGYKIIPESELQNRAIKEKYGTGIENEIQAGLQGFARGATFGLSDQLQVRTGVKKDYELKNLKEQNPAISLIGEIAGIAAPLPKVGLAAKLGKVEKLVSVGEKASSELKIASSVLRETKEGEKALQAISNNFKNNEAIISQFWDDPFVISKRSEMLQKQPWLGNKVDRIQHNLNLAKENADWKSLDAAHKGINDLYRTEGVSLGLQPADILQFAPKQVRRMSKYVDDVMESFVKKGVIDKSAKEGIASKIVKEALLRVPGSAAEGGAYGLGHYISEEALGNRELNIESILADVGFGALVGGGAGALGVGLEKSAKWGFDRLSKRWKKSGVFDSKFGGNLESGFHEDVRYLMDAENLSRGEAQARVIAERSNDFKNVFHNLSELNSLKRKAVGLEGFGSEEGMLIRKAVAEFDDRATGKAMKELFGKADQDAIRILRSASDDAGKVLDDIWDRQELFQRSIRVQEGLEDLVESFRTNPSNAGIGGTWVQDSLEDFAVDVGKLWDDAVAPGISGRKALQVVEEMPLKIEELAQRFISTAPKEAIEAGFDKNFLRITQMYAANPIAAVNSGKVWPKVPLQIMYDSAKRAEIIENKFVALKKEFGIPDSKLVSELSEQDWVKIVDDAVKSNDPNKIIVLQDSFGETLSQFDTLLSLSKYVDDQERFIEKLRPDLGDYQRAKAAQQEIKSNLIEYHQTSGNSLDRMFPDENLAGYSALEDIFVARTIKNLSPEFKSKAALSGEVGGGLLGGGIGYAIGADVLDVGIGSLGLAYAGKKAFSHAVENWNQTLGVLAKIESSSLKVQRTLRKIISGLENKKERVFIGPLVVTSNASSKKNGIDPLEKEFADVQKSLEPLRTSELNRFDLYEDLALAEHAPQHGQALMGKMEGILNYLYEKSPKPIRVRVGRKQWIPREEKVKWLRRVNAAHDPISALERSIAGRVTQEEIETVRDLYPELYQNFRENLFEMYMEDEFDSSFQDMLRTERFLELGLMDITPPQVQNQEEQGPRGGATPSSIKIDTESLMPPSEKLQR